MGDPSEASGQALTLPTGGGAIRGIGETFHVDAFTGTAGVSIPIAVPPGRDGLGPELALRYGAGYGNGPFGLGWQLPVPRITRKTERGLPRYDDDDVFVLTGSEDLVPSLRAGTLDPDETTRGPFVVRRYRPRTEGLFARIERWTHLEDGESHWRVTTRDNVTSLYGRTRQARIADPVAEAERRAGLTRVARIFEWLLEETLDAKGNHVVYRYAADDPTLRLEGPEAERRTYCQRYLRRICYGNVDAEVRYPGGPVAGIVCEGSDPEDPSRRLSRRYVFELVFDFGDGRSPRPPPSSELELFGSSSPPVREDAFSSHRAGFEVRTLRRCDRILVLHHFAELGEPTLVRSMDLAYHVDPETRLSFLASVTAKGYRRDGDRLRVAEMPPVEFRYAAFRPHEQRYRPLRAIGDDLPPAALTDPRYVLVDLFGAGLPDVLEGGVEGFRYWKNLGDGRLDRPRQLPTVPAGLALGQPGVGLADMDGDGRLELLVHTGPLQGFFRATPDGAWEAFKPYPALPSFDPSDPNVRFVDLTGDGRSDALMTHEHHFLWFECLGEEGFAPPRPVERVQDLDAFPDVHFADPSRRLHLADMDGDGLADIVLLHEGRVDYWPNLGYGRFGPRLTMRALPDPPQLDPGFDPKRLALVDLDGTGCADLVYVDFDRVHFWFNQSGNGWSRRQTIHGTPTVSDADAVRFADVFGTGTATLLWTSDFAFQPEGNCKALDFAGGVKPYLLETIDSNMGATTRFRHAPSTRFAVEDAREGRPWITALPFPVHVVEAVEIVDGLQGTRLLSRYRYRHGYYDGREREFRGFGLVEQVDAETAGGGMGFVSPDLDSDPAMRAEAHFAAPALSRTWFCLGVPLDDARRERFRREQYREDPAAFDPPPDDVDTGEDPALAYRALRGRPLHVEMFGLDGSGAAPHPYTVQEHAYRVTLLQRATATARPVHHVTTRETRVSHYERSPADPRVTQELILALDGHGNVTDRVSIAYPRRAPANPEQSALLAAYTRADFVNDVDDVTRYYVGRPCQSRRYEITGVPWSPGAPPLGVSDFTAVMDVDLGQSRPFRPFEWQRPPGHVGVERRLLSWARTYYRRDGAAAVVDLDPGRSPARTLAERLPLGRIDRLGLPYETYRAALTDDLVTVVYGDLLSQGSASRAAAELEAAGYHREPDVLRYWWIPSGQIAFDPSRFHVAVRRRDAFGRDEHVFHDSYALLQTRTVDQIGNERRVELDYRVLSPRALIDQNQNRSEVAFDALGMVTGTAVSGDTLSGFAADLEAAEIDAYLSDPGLAPRDILRGATTRIVYDPHQFRRFGRPAVVATLAREVHAGEPGGGSTPVQQGFLYSDGFGRALQTRLAAEPGPAGGVAASTRWTVTWATVYNNKGKRVEQYEPFFSGTHRFEPPRRHGVAQSVSYDPLLRPVLTLHPNHSFERVLFDGWREEAWDANDTVLLLPEDEPLLAGVRRRHLREQGAPFRSWFDQRIPDRQHPPPPSARTPEQQAALQAAEHAGTPTVTHLDPLGRRCRKVMTTGTAPGSDVLETRYLLDADGNLRAIIDPRGLSAFVHDVDLAGRRLGVDSRDAGRRRSFLDVVGQAIYEWSGEGLRTRHVFDALRRVTEVWVAPPGAPERLAERAVYGETRPNATIRNLRGRIAEKYDAAGVATFDAYDARGYLLRTTRRLAQDYRREPDWSGAVSLGSEVFHADTAYDALNRIVAATVEEAGVASSRCAYRPRYNPANLLAGVDASAFGDSTLSAALAAIEYDARGQRTMVAHGNGVTTRYAYEPETFRLRSVVSTRSDGFTVRHLEYTYDPVGNLTRVADVAFPSVFHANQQVDAISRYRYDAAYRLVEAHGREHEAVGPCHHRQLDRKQTEFLPFAAQPPTDAQALRNYEETYRYDLGDNLVEIVHAAGAAGGWTRRQTVDAASNRLLDSDAGCDGESTFVVPCDRNGNVIGLPHLPLLEWDHRDRLRHARVNRATGGVPDQVYFTYEAAGQRMRKVVERAGRLDEDHLYLGSVEIHRRHSGAGVDFERRTFRVSDDRGPLLLVEQRTVDVAGRESGMPARQVRHQLDDHRGSILLEVDSAGSLLSYEEFYPYGGSAYLAGVGLRPDERRRYRFGGHEQDDETGLCYCGARYYAPWLGRWISPDPIGSADALNLYVFARDNPVTFRDLTGHLSEDTKENLKQLGRDMWNDVKGMGTAVKEGVVDTASRASTAAKAGEYSEAAAYVLQVDKLADRAVFYEDEGATGLETAALVLSEKTGMTDALEAYTGESIKGETLSRAERARKGITGVTGVITTATGVAAGISPRVPKIDPPRVRPQRPVGTTVKAKDSFDMGEFIPGETRRPATIEEIKRFERSEKENVEISEVESRTGSKIETTGGPDHVTIRVGPDTKSTHHTHQQSGLAVFSREDVNDVILNPSLGDDVVHKVTGRWGPTREALESSGLPIPKIDGEFVTVEVTTGLARRASLAGTLRPIGHLVKP